jgi:YidC/Oxa1 family membrane protein insertase
MLRTILVNPLFNLLLIIYAFIPGNDFGIAVIVLTILIRLLLWPLVKKQLHHQKAMKELQPEIAKIKAKTKGDKTRESQMMVELFKEKEINPFGSLGLALVQFPILIALFFVLKEIVDPAKTSAIAYEFVAKFEPIQRIISDPGAFHPNLFGIVDLTKPNAVLAVVAGFIQYLQARQLTPRDATKTTPAGNIGFTMTLLFPFLTVLIGLSLPSALALYWATSSAIALLQQHIVLKQDVSLMQSIFKRGTKNGTSR